MPTMLITGANRGIGLELTRIFVSNGWRVLACCRNPDGAEKLQALADGQDIRVFSLDVTDFDAIEKLAESLKGEAIDLLVNNAGVLGKVGFEDGLTDQLFGTMDYDAWADVYRVNSMAPMKMAETFIGHIMASGQGKIVTLSSGMGSNSNKEGGAYAYRTSKAAATRLMTVLAVDLKDKNVISVALHPGWVRTDMGTAAADISAAESARGLFSVMTALGPEDSGRFISYQGEDMPW